MNPRTGEIRQFPSVTVAEDAGFTVQIPEGELEKVNRMNRRERRKWAARQRSATAPKPAFKKRK